MQVLTVSQGQSAHSLSAEKKLQAFNLLIELKRTLRILCSFIHTFDVLWENEKKRSSKKRNHVPHNKSFVLPIGRNEEVSHLKPKWSTN